MRHLLARLAAGVLATSAAGLGIVVATSAPAAAAACTGATGVTVVVDHGSLGGGVEQVCNAGGGGNDAASLFTGAGFSLTYVQRQPGFVCRINGQPASDPCVSTPPSNAYWGLFWSDGRSGSWSYASLGAGSLTVPDGGYVAFAWQSGSQNAPNVAPAPHASSPPPAPTPTVTPTSGGAGGAGGGAGGGGGGNGGGRWRERRRTGLGHAHRQAVHEAAASRRPPRSRRRRPRRAVVVPDTASAEANGSVASPSSTPTVAPSDSAPPTASGSTSAAAAPSDSASTTPWIPMRAATTMRHPSRGGRCRSCSSCWPPPAARRTCCDAATGLAHSSRNFSAPDVRAVFS